MYIHQFLINIIQEMDIEGEQQNKQRYQQPIIAYQQDGPIQLANQVEEVLLQYEVKWQIQTKKQSIDMVGSLLIYGDSYHLVGGHVDVGVDYRITGSLGTNSSNLIIFVDSENKEEDEECLAEEPEEDENVADEVIGLIKSQGKGNFLMRGSSTILITFQTFQAMQQAYAKISDSLGDQQQWNSQYACDENMEKMISADDIDEDGNIIMAPNQEQEDDEEEEDSQMVDENQQC